MNQEEARGPVPWRNFEKPWETKVENSPTQTPASLPFQKVPPSDLFLPENRKKLLLHLAEIQYPAIRDLVGELLEKSFFLLEPAALTLKTIERIVVEADEYRETAPYWIWARERAALAMHELVMGGGEEEDGEGESDEEKNRSGGIPASLRCAFNALPLEQRRRLYLVGVLGNPIEDAARALGEEPQLVKEEVRKALVRILGQLEGEGKGGRS